MLLTLLLSSVDITVYYIVYSCIISSAVISVHLSYGLFTFLAVERDHACPRRMKTLWGMDPTLVGARSCTILLSRSTCLDLRSGSTAQAAIRPIDGGKPRDP